MTSALFHAPWGFSFFQAVRLLQRSPAGAPVGRFAHPSDEAVRMGAHTGMEFPASEIQSLDSPSGQPPTLRVNVMGLTGPLGVLPLPYTAYIGERQRARDHAARDFLDLFHHRLLSLFYQAWEKYRFGVALERGERDRISHHLADLIGLGTAGLENRQPVPDTALLYYTGILGLHTRPAAALAQMLQDYFGVGVEIEQFVTAWHHIERQHQCRLGEDESVAAQLGRGALLGERIQDQQSRVRVRLGPLTIEQYRAFLPGGDAHPELKALVQLYAGMEFDMEAELVLRREDVPECGLDTDTEAGPRLGWTTWVKSEPFGRDPSDTVLQLQEAT